MSVSIPKRLSREVQGSPVTTSTSDALRPKSLSHPNGLVISPHMPSLPPTSPILPTPISSTSPSPHALVSPSTLGPPSPTSSTSSSPTIPSSMPAYNISEFSQAFPSIDELDEMDSPKPPSLPSVPNHAPLTNGISKSKTTHDIYEPLPARSFPAPAVDPGPRPSSTPLTPVHNAFISRPSSPNHFAPPSIPRKPSGLGLTSVTSPEIPEKRVSPSPERPELPVTNSVFPKTLYEYIFDAKYNVLLLDVRHRAAFDKEHINSTAVVCLEPSVLTRDGYGMSITFRAKATNLCTAELQVKPSKIP